MTQKEQICLEELRREIFYNKATGDFIWLVSKGRAKAGSKAGTKSSEGYLQICFKRKMYFGHRLAWFYVYGEFPKNEIDHINHNKLDNRIENLRNVTAQENQKNRPLEKKSTTKICGVSICKDGIYKVSIGVNKKSLFLGRFKNIEDAVQARKKAEKEYGYHENHGMGA